MIELKAVSKVFGQKIALDDLHLTINDGQIFGLLGPNGAGKTTLIRILTQILEPSKGIVYFKGAPLNFSDVKAFGYLPEERGLYKEMKVLDHLLFLGRLRGMDYKSAKLSANHWMDKFDVSSWSNKRINTLSKGMAQKVQFMGSLMHNPEVIILDEPLSGFDPLNIQLILDEIKDLKKRGKTVIFSTHNMSSVDDFCDEVAIVNHGTLVIHEKVTSLKEKYRTGDFKLRFKGNQIALANALWTSFELLECRELNQGQFEARIRSRGGQKFNDVFNELSGAIALEAMEEQLPTMQDVFLKLVTNEK